MSGRELDADGTDSYHEDHPWEQSGHPLYIDPSQRTRMNWPPVPYQKPNGPAEAQRWASLPAAQSPVTVPGDHDELVSHALKWDAAIPAEVRAIIGTLVTDLATALRTEQRARQEAESLKCDAVHTTLADLTAERDALQKRIEKALALCAKHEHGALRWEDPLPVPEWIPLVRAALTAPTESKTPTPEPIRSTSTGVES